MKILVIAPHMDDEVLGCGGTICRHVSEDDELIVIFVAHRIYDHVYDEKKNMVEMSHAERAKEVLGYSKAIFLDMSDERLDSSVQEIIVPLEKHLADFGSDTVYVPFRGDNNQDHRAVFDAARVALRPAATPGVKNIYMYEVPSSTDQSPPVPEAAFLPSRYVDCAAEMNKKIKAFRCYQTEKRDFPHPRSEEAIKTLARKRGAEMGFEYAESFVVLREKWGKE